MAGKYLLDENGDPNLDEKGNKIPDPNYKEPAKIPDGVDPELSKRLVQEGIDAALSQIKENLDSAYKARDEAQQAVAKFEEEKRQAEITRLQEEGKHKEAYEKELADKQARIDALEGRTTELTRDVDLRAALSGTDFRNEKAYDMALKQI